MGWRGLDPDGRGRAVALRRPTSRTSASRSRRCCDAGCRVFHFDVGDGHFVEPITMGPIVLQSISPLVHARRRRARRAPDGRATRRSTSRPSPRRAATASRSTPRRSTTCRRRSQLPARTACRSASRSTRRPSPRRSPRCRRRRPRALHVDPSRLLGPAVPAGAFDRVRELRAALPAASTSRSTAASATSNIRAAARRAARRCSSPGRRSSARDDLARARTASSCKRSA